MLEHGPLPDQPLVLGVLPALIRVLVEQPRPPPAQRALLALTPLRKLRRARTVLLEHTRLRTPELP